MIFLKFDFFVVDEADQYLSDRDRREHLIAILKKLDRSISQVVLFSATYSDRVQYFFNDVLNDPNLILEDFATLPPNIDMYYIECEDPKREEILREIFKLMEISQTLIFATMKIDVNYLQTILSGWGCVTQVFSASLPAPARKQMFEDFVDGKIKILITTDVLNRGIDVPMVDFVVNFSYPFSNEKFNFEEFKHRCARTGRAGRKGKCLSFCISDNDFKIIQEIKNEHKVNIKQIQVHQLKEILTPSS